MTTANNAKLIAELQRLNGLLSKYRNAYYRNLDRELSPRMYAWIDRYNEIKAEHRAAWDAFCAATGKSPEHEATDIFA
jgi:hypothetical protein